MRDGEVPYALIQSLAGNRCRIVQPFGEDAAVNVRDLDNGKVILEREAGKDDILEFDTTAEHVYVIERKDSPLEGTAVL